MAFSTRRIHLFSRRDPDKGVTASGIRIPPVDPIHSQRRHRPITTLRPHVAQHVPGALRIPSFTFSSSCAPVALPIPLPREPEEAHRRRRVCRANHLVRGSLRVDASTRSQGHVCRTRPTHVPVHPRSSPDSQSTPARIVSVHLVTHPLDLAEPADRTSARRRWSWQERFGRQHLFGRAGDGPPTRGDDACGADARVHDRRHERGWAGVRGLQLAGGAIRQVVAAPNDPPRGELQIDLRPF
jgi:hypothetical protein